jgi:uncharacterized membrane protein YeiH
MRHEVVTVIAGIAGFAFRTLAIMFHWGMPKFIYDKDIR